MKDLRPALRTFLLADPAVSALVGGTRVHPTRLPQDQVEPSIVFSRVSEVGDYHMAGDSGLREVRVQVDAWAQTGDQAVELANAAADRLSGARESVAVDSDFVDLRGVFIRAGRDDYDSLAKMHRVSRDFIVWYGATE